MMTKKYNIKAEWTGSYPAYCHGEWIVTLTDEDGNETTLPLGDRASGYGSDMGTLGTYQTWHFEDWHEVFEEYQNGLEYELWKDVDENREMVLGAMFYAGVNSEDYDQFAYDFYNAVQAQDWRHNSCGGCI